MGQQNTINNQSKIGWQYGCLFLQNTMGDVAICINLSKSGYQPRRKLISFATSLAELN